MPGHLWGRIRAASAEALASGALVPIATEREVLVDGGVAFQIRVAANLRRKDAERRAALRSAFEPGARAARPDPFGPYDGALYVADIGSGHVGLLNKFNVMDNHLLVVTRQFEDQRDLITPADFAALWTCLREIDGLGFYNGGEEGGASQPHKHLQVVGLPFAESGPRIPMEPAWARAPVTDGITLSPALEFPHGLVRLDGGALEPGADEPGALEPGAEEPGALEPGDDVHGVAQGLFERYLALLAHVGLRVREGQRRQPGPYNLLVTRRWMVLVPRVAEHFEGVSLNGLAFAGSMFVRDRAELRTLQVAGPLRALGAVTGAVR